MRWHKPGLLLSSHRPLLERSCRSRLEAAVAPRRRDHSIRPTGKTRAGIEAKAPIRIATNASHPPAPRNLSALSDRTSICGARFSIDSQCPRDSRGAFLSAWLHPMRIASARLPDVEGRSPKGAIIRGFDPAAAFRPRKRRSTQGTSSEGPRRRPGLPPGLSSPGSSSRARLCVIAGATCPSWRRPGGPTL